MKVTYFPHKDWLETTNLLGVADILANDLKTGGRVEFKKTVARTCFPDGNNRRVKGTAAEVSKLKALTSVAYRLL